MSVEDDVLPDTENEPTEEVEKPQAEATVEEAETEEKPEYTEHEKKMFERAKKAEAEVRRLRERLKEPPPKPQVEQKKPDELTPKDLYALMEAKVPQADIDEVIKASKLLGKSISEALQDGFVKARLKDLAEQRQTANATNTTGSKRTTTKITDDVLVEQARQGKDVDPEALATARINLLKKVK